MNVLFRCGDMRYVGDCGGCYAITEACSAELGESFKGSCPDCGNTITFYEKDTEKGQDILAKSF